MKIGERGHFFDRCGRCAGYIFSRFQVVALNYMLHNDRYVFCTVTKGWAGDGENIDSKI